MYKTVEDVPKEQVEDLAHRLRRFSSRVCRRYGATRGERVLHDLEWFREEAKKMVLGFDKEV